MHSLALLAQRQAEWSALAGELKSRLDWMRLLTLILTVIGAIAASVASQMPLDETLPLMGQVRTYFALAGAISLAVSTFLANRFLGSRSVTAWVRARGIAEALKREAFIFACAVEPYAELEEQARSVRLGDERERIERAGDDLVGELGKAPASRSVPEASLTIEDYISHRARPQIEWYRERIVRYQQRRRVLKGLEFIFALAATTLTAVATVTGKVIPILQISFDVAALTGVLTTVAAALLAHLEAERLDYLITTYAATARKLEDGLERATGNSIVLLSEEAIATENSSWITKWTQPVASQN